MKKTALKGVAKVIFVDYNATDTSDILDIHRYLMKETWYKIMFGFIKIMFVGLSNVSTIESFDASLASNYKEPIKCIYISKQSTMQKNTNNC